MAKTGTSAGGVNKNPQMRVKVKSAAPDMTFTVTSKKKRTVDEDEDPKPRKERDNGVARSRHREDEEPIKKKKRLRPVEAETVVKKKKRVVEIDDEDEDDEPVKRKRSTELAVIEPVKSKRISKLKVGKGQLRSIFGDDAEKIHQLLESNDTDSAVTLLYKRMVQTIVDMIPFAEHAIRKSKGARGVYQINSLVSQLRELMVDIQSSQDRGLIGQSIMANIINPGLKTIATEVVQEYGYIKADLKAADMEDKEYQRLIALTNESRARLAAAMTRSFNDMGQQVVAALQR